MTETMQTPPTDPLANNAVDEVDQLFEKLQVLEIHKLRTMYRTSMETARKDLHQLVSSKYRDLVKIAQDIETVDLLCQQVDSGLASVSYRKASFVPYTQSHRQASFDSYCRSQESEHARKEAQNSILDCLIQTKLTKLDLKIIATNRGLRPAPFSHTCYLVYHAQVYYTIEQVFPSFLRKESSSVSKRFQALKTRFVEYIEQQLARYNAFSPQAYSRSNDTYLEKHNLKASDLMTGAGSEIDEVLWDEAYDDEPGLLSRADSQESFSEYMRDSPLSNRLKRYNNTILPIVNYLLVYIILNHNNPDLNTLAKVAERFLYLRRRHLDSLLEQISPELLPTSLNFFVLLQYVENTYQYVTRYFCKSRNDLNTQLKQYTRSWNPTELLGMRAWLPQDLILFNQDIYCIDLPELVLTELSTSLGEFADSALSYFSDVLNKIELSLPSSMVNDALHVFSNYINGLVQLNHLFALADSPSLILQFVENDKKGNAIMNQLATLKEFLKDLLDAHISSISLADPRSVMSHISQDLYSASVEKITFSKSLIDDMTSDMSRYILKITNPSASRSSSQSITDQIHSWFDQYNQALGHLRQPRDEIISGSHLAHIRQLLTESGSGPFSCGGLLSSSVEGHIEELRIHASQKVQETLGLLVELLKGAVSKSQSIDLTRQYELLAILILTDREFYEHANGEHAHTSDLQELAVQVYTNIFKGVSAIEFDAAFDAHILQLAKLEVLDLDSIRPSLLVSSLLYKLASCFLTGSCSTPCNDYSLVFAWDRFCQVLSNSKKGWVDELTTHALSVLKDAGISSSTLFKAILTDLMYINLVAGNPNWAHEIAPKLCPAPQEAVSEEEVHEIISNVTSAYKNSRSILFPIASMSED